MTAELRELHGTTWIVDVECGLEQDWGDDATGARIELDAHNESSHPVLAAGTPA